MSHIASEDGKLAPKDYKRKHDNVARTIHWKLCGKYKLERNEKWCEHAPNWKEMRNGVNMLQKVLLETKR